MEMAAPTSSSVSRRAHCSRVSRKSSLPPTMLQHPASGGRRRRVRSKRPDSSTKRIPTPTLGLSAGSKERTLPSESVVRRVERGFAESGEEALGQSEAAEEEDDVESIASKRVPKEGDSGSVAGEQAGAGVRIGKIERPDSEIGDEEKLNGAGERGGGDAGN